VDKNEGDLGSRLCSPKNGDGGGGPMKSGEDDSVRWPAATRGTPTDSGKEGSERVASTSRKSEYGWTAP
jgi:hypothetical protein